MSKQAKTSAKMCVFCGNPGLSKEHFWPEWAHNLFDDRPPNFTGVAEFVVANSLREPPLVRERQGSMLDKKIRVVCKACNNGWMSRLEEEAKQIILAMISENIITLNVQEQKKIARWAMLKVIVLDQSAPRDAVVDRRDCAEFMAERETSANFTIFVGRCISPRWRLNMLKFSVAMSKTPISLSSPKNVQTTTFGFAGILFYCVVHTAPSLDLSDIMVIDPRCPFVPTDRDMLWPPEQPLDEAEANSLAYSLFDFLDRPNIAWLQAEPTAVHAGFFLQELARHYAKYEHLSEGERERAAYRSWASELDKERYNAEAKGIRGKKSEDC